MAVFMHLDGLFALLVLLVPILILREITYEDWWKDSVLCLPTVAIISQPYMYHIA